MIRRDTPGTAKMVAVVQASDGVRLVAGGQSADEVADLLVGYIRRGCDDVLWPRAAARVRAFIDAGDSYAAIEEYFEHVGARWDDERLVVLSEASVILSEAQDLTGGTATLHLEERDVALTMTGTL